MAIAGMDLISLGTSALFLTASELVQLTGRKMKSKQIEWLRDNGIPCRISATGHPVVTRTFVEGNSDRESCETAQVQKWTPRVMEA